MTDKFQELAEHIWITTHGNKFTQRMGEETIRFTLAQIHNAALEEAAALCERWARVARGINPEFLDQVLAVENRANEIRKLKVKP